MCAIVRAYRRSPPVSTVTMASTSTFHESLYLAALWRHQVSFLCETNRYGNFAKSSRALCSVSALESCAATEPVARMISSNIALAWPV